jgi:hypothetical protein
MTDKLPYQLYCDLQYHNSFLIKAEECVKSFYLINFLFYPNSL